MTIFKRMKSIASVDLNSALDKIENPVSMLKQSVRDMESEIQKGEDTLTRQLFLEKKLELLIAGTAEVIGKREQQARIAMEQQDEELAKIALEDKIKQENKLQSYLEQLSLLKNQANQMFSRLEQIKIQYEELKSKQLTLVSRAQFAQLEVESSQSLFSNQAVGAIRGFSRAEGEILIEARSAMTKRKPNQVLPEQEEYFLQEQVRREMVKLKSSNVRP
ncbi:PspA/IM30 family protein [Mesobacillus foraminis]|uniref:PspA/IM30 family protein n=1 Tax=Mesobacillus foraminis TaxID=279826 RepID=UPI0039A0D60C